MTPELFRESIRATIEELWQDKQRGAGPAVRDRGRRVSLPTPLLEWLLAAVEQSPYLSLPLYTCEATGGDGDTTVAVATAWHLLHAAARLLDDVVDDAVPDLDSKQMVNAAVGLIFLAQTSLTRLRQSRVPAGRIVDVIAAFNRATFQMTAGQASDLAWGDIASLDDYWGIVAAKSGAFFALACQVGAILGTDSRSAVDHYARFGFHLGMLLQISDDLRAVWRPRGRGDLTTLARSLPIVAARSLSSTDVQQELSKLVEQAHADETALLKLQALLQEPITNDSPFPSVIHYVTTQAGLHYQKAREVLSFTVYPGEPRDALLTLLNRVLPAIDVD